MSEFTTGQKPTTAIMNQKTQTVKSGAPTHSTAGRLAFDTATEIQSVRDAAAAAEIKLNKTAETPSTQAIGDAAVVGT